MGFSLQCGLDFVSGLSLCSWRSRRRQWWCRWRGRRGWRRPARTGQSWTGTFHTSGTLYNMYPHTSIDLTGNMKLDKKNTVKEPHAWTPWVWISSASHSLQSVCIGRNIQEVWVCPWALRVWLRVRRLCKLCMSDWKSVCLTFFLSVCVMFLTKSLSTVYSKL